MKSIKYSIRQSVTAIATLCLITDFSFGEVDCQDGLDYKNSCNPYKVKFIKVPKASNEQFNTTSSKDKKHSYKPKSYLETLLNRYSSNYKGEYGLQSLIDRSSYKTLQLKEVDAPKKEEKASRVVKKESKDTLPKYDIKNKEVSKTKKEATKEPKVDKKETKLAKKEPKKEVVEKASKKTDKLPSKKVIVKKELKDKNKSIALKKKSIKKEAKEAFGKKSLYVVKKGDTLSKIAKKFKVDLKELKAINSLDKNNTIKIGQKLKLPVVGKKIEKRKLAKSSKAKKAINKNANYYIVQKGDTLSLIAKKSGVSLTRLREINRLSRSSKIKVGEKIYLKPTKLAKRRVRSFDFAKNIKFKKTPSLKFKKKIRVVATAYTSHRNQTDDTPFLAAWNNKLKPGMKIIAVSHDLIKKYGLTNGVKVKISGLPGYYTVRDKMNKRLRNHIDIYMGVNKRRALQWGRRRIVLYW